MSKDILYFGDISLYKWIKYFQSDKKPIFKYIYLLNKIDKYFLTLSPAKDIEDDVNDYVPDNGMLQTDLENVMYKSNEFESMTRIVIAIIKNVNFKPWQEIYLNLNEAISKSLIEGNYEEYGIELENIISIALSKKLIKKDDFIDIAILRGSILNSRYPTEQEQKKLKIQVFINSIRSKINI